MFFTSASAHLFHGKSHYAHMSCFLCDLSSICFNTFFFSIMQISICSPIWYFKILEPYLIPILGIQCSLNVILILIAQTSFKRCDISLTNNYQFVYKYYKYHELPFTTVFQINRMILSNR